MMRFLCLFFLIVATSVGAFAQKGLDITVELEGYDQPNLYLGYYYGDKTYLADTTARNADGQYVFTSDTLLDAGVYILVMEPDNNYSEILLPEKDQQFTVKTSVENMVRDMTFEGSADNALFYEYLRYLSDLRPQAQSIQQQMQSADEATKASLQAELAKLDEGVRNYQKQLVADNPGTLAAAIVGANINLEMPEFDGTEEEKQYKRFYYTRDHYFDYIDLADDRLLRTPFMFGRVKTFIDQLHIQTPDSIIRGVDYILEETRPGKDMFRYYLIHFLNKYAGSKVVGMDKVYVHIAKNYYEKGLATWTDKEQLQKIIDNANKIEPLLIGKKAPNITMQKRDGTPVELYKIDSEYTILYFWRYDCGHCKESTPYMKEFYEQYKDKDITLMAGCLKFKEDVKGCWDYIDENGIDNWLHTVDPYGRSRFHEKYDLRTTPQIYILNRDKEIVMKKIGAEQLPEVMDKLLEIDQKKASQSGDER